MGKAGAETPAFSYVQTSSAGLYFRRRSTPQPRRPAASDLRHPLLGGVVRRSLEHRKRRLLQRLLPAEQATVRLRSTTDKAPGDLGAGRLTGQRMIRSIPSATFDSRSWREKGVKPPGV
jgi:hypothetical protein